METFVRPSKVCLFPFVCNATFVQMWDKEIIANQGKVHVKSKVPQKQQCVSIFLYNFPVDRFAVRYSESDIWDINMNTSGFYRTWLVRYLPTILTRAIYYQHKYV